MKGLRNGEARGLGDRPLRIDACMYVCVHVYIYIYIYIYNISICIIYIYTLCTNVRIRHTVYIPIVYMII